MALNKLQAELKAPKSSYNSFGKYNYRSCEDILEAVKPLLLTNKAELTLTDCVKEAGGFTYVEATAFISFGKQADPDYQEYSSVAQAGIEKAGGMNLAQAFGAASSYARKYALAGLFLLDDTKDADATNTHDTKPQPAGLPAGAKPKEDISLARCVDKETGKHSTAIIEENTGNVVEVPRDSTPAGSPDDVQIHFGKHRGKKLGEIDAGYLKWLRDNWMPGKQAEWDSGKKKWDNDAELVRALISYGLPEDGVNLAESVVGDDVEVDRYGDDDDEGPDSDVPF
jgi:hypothetical protein